MLKSITLACLFLGSLSTVPASADPHRGCSTGLTMPDDRCAPAGPALFEIDRVERAGDPRRTVLIATKVYANGAWTVADIATPRTATGYLDASRLQQIKEDLARAKWQHMYSAPACPLPPPVTTEISSNGKPLAVEPSCGDSLDAESVRLLAEIRRIVDAAVAPKAPAP